MGLIQEIPTDEVRMGMRVEAVWVEPDRARPHDGVGQVLPPQRRARRRLRDLQGVPVSTARAGVRTAAGRRRVVRPVDRRAARGRHRNEVEMLHAGGGRGLRQRRHHQGRHRLHLLGSSTDYLVGGPFSFVMALDAVGRVAARCARATSRWTAPGRSTRRGCCLQEGEIDTALVYSFGRSSPGELDRGPGPAARPLLPGPAVARPGVAGRPAGAGADRRGHGHRDATSPRWPPAPARRAEQPQRPGRLGPDGRGAAGRGLRRRPAAPPRPAADHRRRRRHRAGRGGPGAASCASARRGSPASTTASRPTALGRPRPDRSPVDASWPAGEARASGRGQVDVAELARPLRPPGADPARGAGPGRLGRDQPLGRRAGRQPAHGRPA